MRAEERRRQVLARAAELFAERGYHKTTIDDIVQRAGVARGTFYLYFRDKRSIFDELLDSFIHDIDERIIRIDPALGTAECLRLMRRNIEISIEASLSQPYLTKILLSDAVGLDPDFDQKLLAFYQDVLELIESSLTLGQEMGVVRKCDVRVVAVSILGAVKEIMYQVTMRGVHLDDIVGELLQLYLNGLFVLPEGARSS
ncbi:MAG: TetR/AcrR family transcriptional regulator [Deltaproteobacteria bacterium CG_4_9_14_3_um_filter_63_12]|nr:MAG: TetR/AcrR family transcriptional regulator [Deltaproteobacteria bacterium CG_4_9_14_3_um_filter_63_12]